MQFHARALPSVGSNRDSLAQLAAAGPSVYDYVILCCFGPELAATRHQSQLRRALQRAGYRAQLARHLIRTSPVLVRESGYNYRLRCCYE